MTAILFKFHFVDIWNFSFKDFSLLNWNLLLHHLSAGQEKLSLLLILTSWMPSGWSFLGYKKNVITFGITRIPGKIEELKKKKKKPEFNISDFFAFSLSFCWDWLCSRELSVLTSNEVITAGYHTVWIIEDAMPQNIYTLKIWRSG